MRPTPHDSLIAARPQRAGVSVRRILSVSAIAVASAVPRLSAQVIISHSGSMDPATEGWTLTSPLGGTVGAVVSDSVGGAAAWNVTDNSVTHANYYYLVPSAGQIAQGNAQGWTLSATLRLTQTAPTAGYMGFGLEDGTKAWAIYPEQTASNDFLVRLYGIGAPSFTLSGQGNDYHTISLIFDPVSSSADVWVDGVERISNFGGTTYSGLQIFFGGGSSGDTGSANYSAVQFTVVPEPAAGAVIAGTLALIVAARRPRRISPVRN